MTARHSLHDATEFIWMIFFKTMGTKYNMLIEHCCIQTQSHSNKIILIHSRNKKFDEINIHNMSSNNMFLSRHLISGYTINNNGCLPTRKSNKYQVSAADGFTEMSYYS